MLNKFVFVLLKNSFAKLMQHACNKGCFSIGKGSFFDISAIYTIFIYA